MSFLIDPYRFLVPVLLETLTRSYTVGINTPFDGGLITTHNVTYPPPPHIATWTNITTYSSGTLGWDDGGSIVGNVATIAPPLVLGQVTFYTGPNILLNTGFSTMTGTVRNAIGGGSVFTGAFEYSGEGSFFSVPRVSGVAGVGSTLSASTGSWAYADSFSYQWLRDGVAIPSATASTYLLTTSDINANISCIVSGVNLLGTTPHTTESVLVEPDPYYSFDSLVLNFDEAHGSTTFTDKSPTPKVVTGLNGAQIVDSSQFLGGSAGFFDGYVGYLSIPNHADFDFGSGPFTIEMDVVFWAYPVYNGGNYVSCLLGKQSASSTANQSFVLYVSGTATSITTLTFHGIVAGGAFTTVSVPYNFALNTKYAIAVKRERNLLFFYVNDVLLNPNGSTFTPTLQASTTSLFIGALHYDATFKYMFKGYIGALRITKEARPVSNSLSRPFPSYTEPALQSYYEYIDHDVSLAHYRLTETSGSTLVDSSGNGRNGTLGSGYTLNATSLLDSDASNKAITCSGLGDPATVPYASWMIAPQFTVSCVVRPTVVNVQQSLVARYSDATTSSAVFKLKINDSGKAELMVYYGTQTLQLIGDTTLVAGTKYYIVGTYNGSCAKVFVNGHEDGSVESIVAVNATIAPLTIGYVNSSTADYQRFTGTMDEVEYYSTAISPQRVIKRATSIGVTPVTTDPSFSSVRLLVNYEDKKHGLTTTASFPDLSSYLTPVSSVGSNVITSRNRSRNGWTSMHTNGGGVLYGPDTNLTMPGDFTVELDVYLESVPTNISYFFTFGQLEATNRVTFFTDATRTLIMNVFDAPNQTFGSSTIPLNQWTRLCFTRSGSTIRAFCDGALFGSHSYAGTVGNGTGRLTLGAVTATVVGGVYFDNVRVTRGIARYTAAYTVLKGEYPKS